MSTAFDMPRPSNMRRLGLLRLLLCFAFAAPLCASDISITAGSVAASTRARKSTGLAGETITAGQTLYRKLSDSRLWKADANASLAASQVVGIATTGGSAGQRITYAYYDPSFTLGGTIAAGGVVISTATAGGIALAADAASGWYVTILGVGIGSNKIFLDVVRSDVPK